MTSNMKYDVLTDAYCELIHSMGRLKTFEKKISEEFNPDKGAYFSNPMTYHCTYHLKTAQRELKENFIKFVISGLRKQHKNLIVDENEIMSHFGYGYNPIGKEDSYFSARDVVDCFNKLYDPEKMDQVIYDQIVQTAKKSVVTLYRTEKGIERFRKDARGLIVSYNDTKYDASNTNYTSALLKFIDIKLKLVLPTEVKHVVINSGVPHTTSWGVIRGYQNGKLKIVFNEIKDADEIFNLLLEWTIEYEK